MKSFEIGVILPGVTESLREAARHAEDAGLDGVWHGDHLAIGRPTLDAPIALATAAAATSTIRIGTSVFIPAIRPVAWAAKQIATLQYVSGNRLVLGVGSGGGPEQWAAAGVAYERRGSRTDTALELLPKLLAGEKTHLRDEPGQPTVTLTPAADMPPVWVGNASQAAIRRAARLGDGWFPSLVSPREVTEGKAQLAELAASHGRAVPVIAIGAAAALGTGPGVPSRAQIATGISGAYGRPLEEVMEIPLTGHPQEAAERLDAYREAGASHAVIGISGGDWRTQVDLLAEVKGLLLK
ncbi:Flavin-dependent oxidoreductase, luciferase family (includes alkanesulfonate monooxygenase SsuD and methylene tetrahydromethanopterin reductase) [Nonomuraea solani]|uniref:Flavin-dependent oxidoreductase, luciferase family (Includes alkanesulfonate monooxygenase SsuD and methylene tetrahydromethanopterin reductase) n=1 Tax=Nonomuraea solani TaxID=1144553 RepID=A0A1H6ER62_9ACTN|nr:LLM class flavin-dependent oxidoreductase [Nonomuraea solani]SEH00347.1 Flavin-dependent oxidoreductase, luciferase family (includes alkanesulfonate monooxygenase SsuD and methylene tetrahydromethanopterin reductase) [Nonomuraea solani]